MSIVSGNYYIYALPGIARFTVAEWESKIVACLITIQAGITVSYNVPCSQDQRSYLTGKFLAN